jgi:hypothetical protein
MATTPATVRGPIAARELRETLVYTFALAHWETATAYCAPVRCTTPVGPGDILPPSRETEARQ